MQYVGWFGHMCPILRGTFTSVHSVPETNGTLGFVVYKALNILNILQLFLTRINTIIISISTLWVDYAFGVLHLWIYAQRSVKIDHPLKCIKRPLSSNGNGPFMLNAGSNLNILTFLPIVTLHVLNVPFNRIYIWSNVWNVPFHEKCHDKNYQASSNGRGKFLLYWQKSDTTTTHIRYLALSIYMKMYEIFAFMRNAWTLNAK